MQTIPEAMVMSYRGVAKAKPKKTVHQPVNVEDHMSRRLVTFHPDQTMDQVIDILLKKGISGGPVVDDHNNLVGIISEGDCLKEVVRGKYHNTPKLSGKVSEHMATKVKTVNPEMNIFELAQMYLDLRLRRFPVIRDGKLVGQISQRDVMKAVKQLKDTNWS